MPRTGPEANSPHVDSPQVSESRSNGIGTAAAPAEPGRRRELVASVLLAILVVAIFGSAVRFDFVPFDDDTNLLENPSIRRGLDAESLKWAFGMNPGFHYLPLTWLSHALDFSLFADDPAGPHAVNVLLHAGVTVLLFLFLSRSTGDRGASALVAALFGVHPLRSESVAWVSERKDVLSVFLALVLLLAWARRAREPSRPYRLALVVLFLAGLLAKPMLVTLPFVLLLVDVWPIGRASADGEGVRPLGRRALEVAPFFVLSAVAAAGAVLTQDRSGALASLETSSLPQRLAVALHAYFWYAWKTILPQGLSIFYPLAMPSPGAIAAGAATVLLLAVLGLHPRVHPAVRVGSLWYLVTLLPVSGLVRIGDQLVADRYSYLPTIGLLIAAVFGLRSFIRGAPRSLRNALAAAAITVVSAFALYSAVDCRRFRNGLSLFSSALETDPRNWLAQAKVGDELVRLGRPREALPRYAEALRLRPDWEGAAGNYAQALLHEGRTEEALATIEEGLRRNPSSEWLHRVGAVLFERAGRPERARVLRRQADDLQLSLGARDSNPSRRQSLRPFRESPGR